MMQIYSLHKTVGSARCVVPPLRALSSAAFRYNCLMEYKTRCIIRRPAVVISSSQKATLPFASVRHAANVFDIRGAPLCRYGYSAIVLPLITFGELISIRRQRPLGNLIATGGLDGAGRYSIKAQGSHQPRLVYRCRFT